MDMSCMAGTTGEEKPMATTSTGYCFSGASSTGNQNIPTHLLHSFQSPPPPEIYNLSAGDMIGFQSSKNNLHQQNHPDDHNSALWKGFFSKHHGAVPSSSKEINEPTSNHEFYHHDLTGIPDTSNENMIQVSSDSFHHHHNIDPSMRVAVFPCEGNERPSQGLSLSLSSSNPSTIGLQSFELRHQQQQQQQQHDHHHDNDHLIRFGPSSSSRPSPHTMMNIQHLQIRSSKYLGPAQELLNEFCNLETKQDKNSKMKAHKDQWQAENENAVKKQSSVYSLDILELQRRKSKLLQMLEEVDGRYRHYCDQMKSVVSSFEAVAGNGAATVYSALASRAMSRHFRCLRDGIVGQIKETKKAMGEKDSAAPGTAKGETPRLRLLDQTLRQQKALQQMSIMETHPWRPQRGLPERSVSVLRAWLFEHFLHPYPSDVDKHILARQTGLSRSQVSNWFINARVRLWKPMVEEMYLEELKEADTAAAADGNDHGLPTKEDDQKPSHDQLVRIDSECLSSIINNPSDQIIRNDPKKNKTLQPHNDHHHNHSFGRVVGADSYSTGAMELDFSSYNHHAPGGGATTVYGGGGVSLTLGLHQHGGSGGGVSLAFSPSSQQSSLFYPRSEIEDQCQNVHQYSLLDGENQNLPYRNLMGAQLLHDLAG